VSPFPAAPAESLVEDREPRFDATVPKQFAHKRAVEEIFLTDVLVRESRGQMLACAQLPRSHALYNEIENGFHDLLLILEIGRQGMTIYGHGWLDVPEETAFVMGGLQAEVIDLEALRQGEAPAELVIDVPFGGERRDGRGRVRGYHLAGVCAIDGRPAIDFCGDALLIPKALYERVRSVRVEGKSEIPLLASVPVAPARVGRRSPRNIAVADATHSAGELRCALVADTSHPSFFDHPLDHVPGMLMLEAARQAALLYVGELGWPPAETVLDACEARFTQYAALSPPATCRVLARERPLAGEPLRGAEPAPGASAAPVEYLRVHFAQAAQGIGHVDLRLRRVGA
jgi:2-oxo-3-(phosphooxy)propyl 3-oxoalkanoate synthase